MTHFEIIICGYLETYNRNNHTNHMKYSAKEIMNRLAHNSGVLKEITDDERSKLQNILLGILKDVIEVCDNNNIRVALVGGSALGAVRHGGFIPWDDDIDLGMPREDWERFKTVFNSSLGYKYDMEAPNYDNKDCKNTWGKIYLRGTVLEEIQDISMPYNKGIFLDIFIWDNVSSNQLVRKIDAKVSDFLKGVATSMTMYKYANSLEKEFYAANKETNRYYNLRRALGFFFSWCSHKSFCSFYDRFVSRHGIESELCTAPTGRKNYEGEIIEKKQWVLKPIKFENVNAYVFYDVHGYLKQMYGNNYMQLPPENKRERHFIVKLKF